MSALRPDPEHDAVCASGSRHLLVVAPPGTGKTCLAVRLARAIAPALGAGERVLLVTFSNQARVQLEHEAARQLGPDVRQRVEVTNYHRFFWRSVRAYRRALGLPLTLEIGSRRRRLEALRAVDATAVKALRRHEGLLDALAEHAFEQFRDERTPDPETLAALLAGVEVEQRTGRLVFDDLGALFWQLLEQFPTVAGAYCSRYPAVIADEHQDASALQDAIVRRLATMKLVILADPMQLIHGFRGARLERLQQHRADADEVHELRTPHRWHGNDDVARWLLAVRARLQGEEAEAQAPPSLRIEHSPADRGFNGTKPQVKYAVSRGFRDGAETVAVLAWRNDEVAQLRAYLSNQGLHPRQLGGPDDFEEAREDIEQLPLLGDAESIARHALARLAKLVPTLDRTVVEQVGRRLGPVGVDLARRPGAEAATLLRALHPL